MCGKRGVILEDGVDVPVKGRDVGDVPAVQKNPAGGWPFEARDHP
jgi:hypothetical protein